MGVWARHWGRRNGEMRNRGKGGTGELETGKLKAPTRKADMI